MRVCVFVCVHCNSTEKSSTNDGFGGGKEEKPNHTESRNVYEMTINETKLQREWYLIYSKGPFSKLAIVGRK